MLRSGSQARTELERLPKPNSRRIPTLVASSPKPRARTALACSCLMANWMCRMDAPTTRRSCKRTHAAPHRQLLTQTGLLWARGKSAGARQQQRLYLAWRWEGMSDHFGRAEAIDATVFESIANHTRASTAKYYEARTSSQAIRLGLGFETKLHRAHAAPAQDQAAAARYRSSRRSWPKSASQVDSHRGANPREARCRLSMPPAYPICK
eukprot:990397-Pleurochrysis_carterae.AAC.3